MVGPLSGVAEEQSGAEDERYFPGKPIVRLSKFTLHQDTRNLALCRNKMTPCLCMCEAVMKSNKTHAMCGV